MPLAITRWRRTERGRHGYTERVTFRRQVIEEAVADRGLEAAP